MLPVEVYRQARSVFERAIDRPSESGRTTPFTERVVVLVFGLALLAVGPVFRVLTPANGDARLVVLYAGTLMGVFGLLFVWFAAVT